MTQSTYNGWTNYETWRVNLEMFDGQPVDWMTGREEAYDLGLQLKDLVDEYLEQDGKGIALDYARAFVQNVNFTEIARHMIEDYNESQAA